MQFSHLSFGNKPNANSFTCYSASFNNRMSDPNYSHNSSKRHKIFISPSFRANRKAAQFQEEFSLTIKPAPHFKSNRKKVLSAFIFSSSSHPHLFKRTHNTTLRQKLAVVSWHFLFFQDNVTAIGAAEATSFVENSTLVSPDAGAALDWGMVRPISYSDTFSLIPCPKATFTLFGSSPFFSGEEAFLGNNNNEKFSLCANRS